MASPVELHALIRIDVPSASAWNDTFPKKPDPGVTSTARPSMLAAPGAGSIRPAPQAPAAMFGRLADAAPENCPTSAAFREPFSISSA
jgi:hypothetical protein